MKLPEEIEKKRDTLANVFSNGASNYDGIIKGFNAAWFLAMEEVKPVLNSLMNEAQGFKSMANPHDHGNTNMQCLETRIGDARELLKKLNNEK